MSVWPHHFQHRQIHDCGFTTQSFEENGMCFSNRPVIQQHKRSFVCSGHEGKRYCCKCKEQTNQQRHLSQHVNEAEAVFTNHSVTISTATWIEAFSSPHGPLSLLQSINQSSLIQATRPIKITIQIIYKLLT